MLTKDASAHAAIFLHCVKSAGERKIRPDHGDGARVEKILELEQAVAPFAERNRDVHMRGHVS